MTCICRKEIDDVIKAARHHVCLIEINATDDMGMVGMTYLKCVYCREITDIAVLRNKYGYAIMHRRPGTEKNKYCRSIDRMETELFKIMRRLNVLWVP